jgi:peptidyl-prolyl cis-trans isomerase SurA
MRNPLRNNVAVISLSALACALVLTSGARAQTQTQPRTQTRTPAPSQAPARPAAAAPAPASPVKDKGTVIEEVVARVNNEVITRGDIERASRQLREEIAQDCAPTCTRAEVDRRFADAQKDLLRDLIDNSLLVQRAKDAGITVDAQVVKRLDEIRIENHIASMEELEKKVSESGQDFQDFKDSIKKTLLQQEIIRKEVGTRILVDHSAVLKYYEDHKAEFVRPEQVVLREMFFSTAGKSEAQTADQRKKAEGMLQRVKDGEDFGELAKRFSDGSTANQGGDLGLFEKSQLAGNLAEIVFTLKRNETTAILPTKDGLLILQVREHYPAGQQPEDKVDEEIANKLFSDQMKPGLRKYLQTLRQDSYVQVKAGYVDTAGVSENNIEETPPSPDSNDIKNAKGKGKSKPAKKKSA